MPLAPAHLWRSIVMAMNQVVRKHSNLIIGLGAALFVLGAWGAAFAFLPSADAGTEAWAKAGTRGDAFGALNALFSGLAFAGFLLALKMQRDELVEQRRENHEAREEAKRHTEATERMRVANLLGVMAQINTTLGEANRYGHVEIAELRRILASARSELQWSPEKDDLESEVLRGRANVR